MSQSCVWWGKYPAGAADIGNGTFCFTLFVEEEWRCPPLKSGNGNAGMFFVLCCSRGRPSTHILQSCTSQLGTEIIVPWEAGFSLAVPNCGLGEGESEVPPPAAATDTAWDPLPFLQAPGHCFQLCPATPTWIHNRTSAK